MNLVFNQYDIVRIVKFNKPIIDYKIGSNFYMREPKIGDIATIVEIYSNPMGYELECCEKNDGVTSWLHSFKSEDIELELIKELK